MDGDRGKVTEVRNVGWPKIVVDLTDLQIDRVNVLLNRATITQPELEELGMLVYSNAVGSILFDF